MANERPVIRTYGKVGCQGLRHPSFAADDGLVKLSTRLLPLPAGRHPVSSLRLTAALLAPVFAALAFVVAPAGAVVTTVASTKVGLQPREAQSVFEGMPTVESFDNPEGSLVLHKNETYAIYWDPTDHYHGDWQHLIDTFFQGLGADSGSTSTVFAVDSQYTDKSNLPASYLSTFRGAYTDADPYPVGVGNCKDPHPLEAVDRIGPGHTEVCLTDAEVRKELKAFIAAHSLQKGVGSIFYLLTPPAVAVCLDAGGPTGHCSDHAGSIEATGTESYKNSFCSYHSDFSNLTLENMTTPDANTVLYGVIPWSAGGLGDRHLTGGDQTPAYDCQDGGWYLNGSTHRLEKEKSKEKGPKEIEEQEKRRIEQSKEATEKEENAEELEKPHQQEPNQAGLGPDGSYDTGLADLIVSQIGVQQQNIVTDPLLNGWQDSAHNEVTDECRNFFQVTLGGSSSATEETFAGTLYNQSFAGANAYINDAFNLAAGRLPYPGVPCMNGIDLVPQFTAPNPINTGELVGFDGMESDITLNDDIGYSKTGVEEPKYATYKWNFGDGTPEVTGVAPGAPSLNSPETSPCELPWKAPCDASTFHSYQYGGEYTVTLTVTDTGGNKASVSQQVTVDGPLPPSAKEPTGGGSGVTPGTSTTGTSTTGSTAGTGSSAPGATTEPLTPAPVVSERILSTSLPAVLRNGLIARYSVSAQVAGRFEVILNANTAKLLGIHGSVAAGLPAGSPRSLVIAQSILVTTKGGHSTVKIKLSKHTVAALRKAKKVSLMLRMIVRNAAKHPQIATSLSSATLHR